MLVSKNPCGPNAKPDRPSTKPGKPNASRWDIACIGSLDVGHVHFMLFVAIIFALGTQHKPVFGWNMGKSFKL